MGNYRRYSSFPLVVFSVIFPFGVVGWGLNIYKIISSTDPITTGLMIVRIIGIFVAPLGGLLGYF